MIVRKTVRRLHCWNLNEMIACIGIEQTLLTRSERLGPRQTTQIGPGLVKGIEAHRPIGVRRCSDWNAAEITQRAHDLGDGTGALCFAPQVGQEPGIRRRWKAIWDDYRGLDSRCGVKLCNAAVSVVAHQGA